MSSEEIAPIVPAVDEALIPPLSLDALPPEVLNMILTSLDMPSSAVGRVACVSQSLRVTVGSLPFWKDVRVIGGLHELNAAVSEGLSDVAPPPGPLKAEAIFREEYIKKKKKAGSLVMYCDLHEKGTRVAEAKLKDPAIRAKYDTKSARMVKKAEQYRLSSFPWRAVAQVGDGISFMCSLSSLVKPRISRHSLDRLLTICTGPVHTLVLASGCQLRGPVKPDDRAVLSAVVPRIVAAWGPSLRFLCLGSSVATPDDLRALLAGCPNLVLLDASALTFPPGVRRAELFSRIGPHSSLRSVSLPPAPEATPAAFLSGKVGDTVLGSYVRDLCTRCCTLLEINANATMDAYPEDDFSCGYTLVDHARRFLMGQCAIFAASCGVRRFLSESYSAGYNSEGGGSSCDSVGVYCGEGNILKNHYFPPATAAAAGPVGAGGGSGAPADASSAAAETSTPAASTSPSSGGAFLRRGDQAILERTFKTSDWSDWE